MLNKQIGAMKKILTDEDLQKYTGDSFWNLIQAVILADPLAGAATVKDVKEIIFHIPTVLFWDKMKRYLLGTFSCFDEQIKMAEKFNHDSNRYTVFIKKQIHLINAIDDDKKIDYFSSLTRCFLMTSLDENLFFKLSKFIVICTSDELQFIEDISYTYKHKNTAIISSLYQYGLFIQGNHYDQGDVMYELSDFGRALKQNSLNFDDGLKGDNRITSFEMISPLNFMERVDDEEFAAELEEWFKDD